MEKVAEQYIELGRLMALGFEQELEERGLLDKEAGAMSARHGVSGAARRGVAKATRAVSRGASKAKAGVRSAYQAAKTRAGAAYTTAAGHVRAGAAKARAGAQAAGRHVSENRKAYGIGAAATGAAGAGGYYAGQRKTASYNRLMAVTGQEFDGENLFGDLIA